MARGRRRRLRMLAGLTIRTRQRAGGRSRVKDHVEAVKDQIGYMAQRFGLYGDLTVAENMIFYSDLFGLPEGDRDRMMGEFSGDDADDGRSASARRPSFRAA